jgi:hypothetical protein
MKPLIVAGRDMAGQQTDEPVDVVYTWVDDSFPGYLEYLRQYADSSHDLNPNRTRDNIDILKYNLRSLVAHVPWVRHVYLVTCRPQAPHWLNTDHPGLTLIHHDSFMPTRILPTFNSFAILTNLYRIEGLSERFLYVEDDMFFGRPAPRDFFEMEDGRIRVYPRIGRTCSPAKRDSGRLSPWNTALAYSNYLLDAAFGAARRRSVNHVPFLIDRTIWAEMIERWPEDFARTSASRFRAKYNVVPEFMYLYYTLLTGRGALASLAETYRNTFYTSLENNYLVTAWGRFGIQVLRPVTAALNDGFGEYPNPGIVARSRQFLDELFPDPSPFEA